MWKTPAAASAALLALAGSAAAQDLGRPVLFGAETGVQFSAQAGGPAGAVLRDFGPSAPVEDGGDILLLQGYAPEPGVSFEAARGGEWEAPAWKAAVVRRFPGGRFWARVALPARGARVRLRALDAGVKRGHSVEVYAVELADSREPEGEAFSAAPPRGAGPEVAAPMPAVISRERWGARLPREAYTPMPEAWRVTIHHAAGRRPASPAESLQEAAFIQDYHQNGRGWNDIGYHYLVDPFGNVLAGRPEDVQGAHVRRRNQGNVGICLLGDFHPPRLDEPSAVQLAAAAALARSVMDRKAIAAAELLGHRDRGPTDCPGDNAYARLPDLRRLAGF